MNRIATLGPLVVSPSHSSSSSGSSLATVDDETSLDHALVGPLHYEKNYAYPLVVWLHGPNGNEGEIRQVIPHVSLRNYVSIAPRGTAAMSDGSLGFHWEQTEHAIAIAERTVLRCIDRAHRRFNVATSRVFIAGYKCGGTMALRLGIRNPSLFAGALSFGGPFPTGNTPLSNLAAAQQVPLLIARGCESKHYSIERVCDELRLFHAARLRVALRLYPGDDDLTTKMLQDMDHWIMEQVTGQRTQEERDFPLGEAN